MTFFLSVAGLVYALDQMSKAVIRQMIPLGGEVLLWPFFSLVHVQNTGVAFGLFPQQNAVFIVL